MSRLTRIAEATREFILNMYEVHPETHTHTNIRCPHVQNLANAFQSFPTPRDLVYEAIDTERDYQDHVWRENAGKEPNCPVRTVAEELLMLEEYVAHARSTWTTSMRKDEVFLTTNVLRKCAAICVRALENHGAPHR